MRNLRSPLINSKKVSGANGQYLNQNAKLLENLDENFVQGNTNA